MVTTRKQTGKAMSMPAGLTFGAAVSLGITIIVSIIIAKMVDTGTMEEAGIGYGAMVILLVSSISGAFVSTGMIKRQKLIVCVLSGVIYYLTLLSITGLFFGGQYNGMGITALLVAGGCTSVILLGMRQGRGRKKAVGKWKHR